MNKLKILFFIALIIIGVKGWNVKATSLSFSNAKVGFSSIKYDSTYGYNYSLYTEHINNNTSYTTTTSNGFTYLTRARFYVYVDSSNSLQKTRQYTFNYKICTAWENFNGYFSSANIKLLNVMKSTGTNITDAVSEEASSVSISRTAVSGSPNCSNLIIIYRPTTNNLRTVGFWVSFLDFVPNTNTCYVGDCGNVGYNSFTGELLQTYNGSYGNNGYFKYTLTASYEDSSGNAIIEQNTQTIINQQNEIKNSINSLPQRIWATIKADLQALFVPTDVQMQGLMDEVEETMTSKLGLLGLPATLYFNVMHILEDVESESNWCFSWNAVKVPNFESYNIIQAGNWCFDSINENEKIASMRTTAHLLMGALILLGFVGYLWNKKNVILEIPDREDYIYITEEDSFMYDINSGEVVGNGMHKTKKTERRMKK